MPRRILVIDDERHITRIVAFKLTQAGYEVATAGDGEEGYQLACEQLPDLIVTDYQMPHLDGYAMCVKLRQSAATAEVPVILLTARGHKLAPSELLATNIQCILQKPFSAHDLLTRIAEMLGEAANGNPEQQQVA